MAFSEDRKDPGCRQRDGSPYGGGAFHLQLEMPMASESHNLQLVPLAARAAPGSFVSRSTLKVEPSASWENESVSPIILMLLENDA